MNPFKKKQLPKVSIIVISHRHKLLNLAIESIERQDYPNIEVLIHHTLADPHVQMLEVEKVNRLVKASVGEYISILCEDDEFEPTFVEKTVTAILKNDADLVYTDRATIGQTVQFFESGEFTKEAFNKSIVSPLPGTFLVHRKWWDLVGGYTSNLYADHHITRELCRYGAKGYHLKEPLFLYRIHLENRTRNDNHVELMTQYYSKYPHYAKHLNPANGINEWQVDTIKKVLNNIYGDESRWPVKHVQLL